MRLILGQGTKVPHTIEEPKIFLIKKINSLSGETLILSFYPSIIYSQVFDGRLGYFHVLAIINSAAMNIGVHISLSILVFLVCVASSGIAGS